MSTVASALAEIVLRDERDVVVARRGARDVARALGLEPQDQVRVATAVSEVARALLVRGGETRVALALDQPAGDAALVVRVGSAAAALDPGAFVRVADPLAEPGHGQWPADGGARGGQDYPDGRADPRDGVAPALAGARRLMDDLAVVPREGGGASVVMRKRLPRAPGAAERARMGGLAAAAARDASDPLAESAAMNRELVRVLGDLAERNEQLARLDRELEDTNRGVVALYAELDQRALDLQRADETKTRFLSNVSHELRTPLNSIRALCDLLMDEADGPLTEGQRTQVGFIRESAGDLRELVDDLLDLARIQAGKEVVRAETVPVDALFSALRGVLRPLAVDPAVALVFEAEPGLVLVSDEQKLAQILRNFVSNALKFTEAGAVRVSARAEVDRIVFAVADSGIGIVPEHQGIIFEEFVQIDSPLARKRRGTGLGLPLCRRLATLLGGSIELESAPGKGSTFTLRVPRELAPAQDLA